MDFRVPIHCVDSFLNALFILRKVCLPSFWCWWEVYRRRRFFIVPLLTTAAVLFLKSKTFMFFDSCHFYYKYKSHYGINHGSALDVLWLQIQYRCKRTRLAVLHGPPCKVSAITRSAIHLGVHKSSPRFPIKTKITYANYVRARENEMLII